MNSSQSGSGLEDRLAELERKVTALESASTSGMMPGTTPADPAAPADPAVNGSASGNPTAGDDTFWALNGLIDRLGEEGGVTYTGHTTPPGADVPVSWQVGLDSASLGDLSFAEAAPALAALGNPVRLELLQAIYEGASTVAELGRDERFGTTGQIYHHVNALAGAGWLENSRRGHWRVPAPKIIPLLTLVLIGTH
ncbi:MULTISPECIES: winged helix-turn-helix domain-containing protein [unclassified Brevibacterium]|uniref:ArsR/SmtB family transcription factor n=1 Tax=unclassified Brevibacterium TaxID=2614124 RepID=UPI001E3C67E4|nr:MULTISPECIES: winged helix-turn-helix domain-containing protein [unclassified Brevibacterium]MDK8433939.1 winged helix-turn-helix domain-containing protein [Brevibacterium sp. H-BE7]